ncbi:MAG: hypothetical protein MK052_09615 [Alphaproteobacteria bacterium]|nr:hypothetical protein [Alphaproteobacteria bacterium]
MGERLQPFIKPLTRYHKWGIYTALWPLCLALSLATLYIKYDRPASMDDVLVGYLMMPFALPYSFLHTATFNSWFDGQSHPMVLIGFWLPFIILHGAFFYSRPTWVLAIISIVWIIAAFQWHYYALVFMRM